MATVDIVSVCATIITVGSAITIIYKGYLVSREPEEKQNKKIKNNYETLQAQNKRIECMENKMERLENSQMKTNRERGAIYTGLLAMIDYSLGGDVKKLEEARSEIHKALIGLKGM